MFVQNIKKTIRRYKYNLKGWRTKKKILVIESDDWGSIRMPSKDTFEALFMNGIKVDKCPYCRFDNLATTDDLSHIFEVLTAYKDYLGNHPIITANTIVCNPNFNKIRKEDFTNYSYELFTETLKKYPNCEKSIDLWFEGIKAGVFYPQLHGREHLNVNRWMHFLQEGSSETRLAFDYNVFGISTNITSEKRRSYLAAFDYELETELPFMRNSIYEAQRIFTQIFGYKSRSFIAPNYYWSPEIEDYLSANSINFIQGSFYQNLPFALGDKKMMHFIGQKNNNNQVYLVRNCIFEPSINGLANSTENCLKDIQAAFNCQKPAIITSHRLNFIGSLVKKNREDNLKSLSDLISKALKRWPNIEFWNSEKLGEFIRQDLN